jgi:hypothetical protein
MANNLDRNHFNNQNPRKNNNKKKETLEDQLIKEGDKLETKLILLVLTFFFPCFSRKSI